MNLWEILGVPVTDAGSLTERDLRTAVARVRADREARASE